MDELNTTLEQCLLHALHIRNLSPLYISAVRGSCRLFFAHSKVRSIEECSTELVESWLLDGRAFRKWSAATFRSRHRDLGFLFRYLLKRGKITNDPTKGIELPKLGHSLPKGLSMEDSERVLACAKRMKYTYRFEAKRNHALVAILLFTGLRKSEAINLRLQDVDLEHLRVNVIQGKGKKDRIVPISTRLAAILGEYLLDRARLDKRCDSFLVTAQYDNPLTVKSVNAIVKQLSDKAGIKFSCHSLRHTFATLMLEGGCDLYTLSRMMGHSKITTTTIYLACTAKLMMSSIEKHPLN